MKFSYVPAYGFGKAKKCELTKTDQLITPGPGKYSPVKNSNQQPIWKIGTSKRPKEQNLDNPGPGAYNIRFKFPDGPSYSMATKPQNFLEKMITPGPAAYKPINLDQSACYSFGQKYKNKENEMSPGPGNYNIRTEKDLSVPSSIFGHEKRIDTDIKNNSGSPGPGKYNINNLENTTNVKHPQYSFGREKRITDNINDNPGPGSYKYKEYVGKEGKKPSMGLKFKSKSMVHLPGPGQYQTNNYNSILKKLPDIKIGKAKRFINNSQDNPGPGQYNNADQLKYVRLNKPSWKIGTSTRKPLNDVGDSPGPGQYNISKKIGDGAPQYSMRIKENGDGNRFITPGPGRYNEDLKNLKHYPSWKIGTSKRDDSLKRQIKEGFPGPGTYENYNNHLLSPPKYGFGTQKRYKDKYNDNPGPGSYHIPCSIIEVNDYTREQGVFDDNFKFI